MHIPDYHAFQLSFSACAQNIVARTRKTGVTKRVIYNFLYVNALIGMEA